MKTHWKGMLSFGLVNIPVALYSATRKKNIRFNQLRKSDFSRIRYKKVAHDGEEVAQSDIVKGYEISADNYVVVEDRELDKIAPKASRIIDIGEFVKADKIDPRHYDAAYYLAPESGMGKAYALLLEAMKQANVVGIAKFVLRSREYLAAIRPAGKAMMLSTMLFADEIVSVNELQDNLPDQIDLAEKELKMAKQLVESLIVDFEPAKYENQYYKQVMSLIEGKAEVSQIVHEPVNNSGMVVDLMAALEASLAQMKQIEKPKKRTKKKA